MSNLASRLRPFRARLAVAGVSALAAAAGLSVVALTGTSQAASSTPCSASQTEIWLGDGSGGGTAGTIFYPLEFSNISHRTCSLLGYPGVSVVSATNKQIGKPATRQSGHASTVTLKPGATAHALLGIHDAGAICGHPASAHGLKVYAPGERTATTIETFAFGACSGKSVLAIQPVHSGTGVPGYTTS